MGWPGLSALVMAASIATHPSLAADQRRGRQPDLTLTSNEEAIAAYRAQTECEGKWFDVIKIGLMVDNITAGDARYLRQQNMMVISQTVAARWNTFAGLAAEKGCGSTARTLYLYVIETFTGSAYAAMRQRAQIGIDDLRAAQVRDSAVQRLPE
jgi:hypothetical protein